MDTDNEWLMRDVFARRNGHVKRGAGGVSSLLPAAT
jgi:hypothetical protein